MVSMGRVRDVLVDMKSSTGVASTTDVGSSQMVSEARDVASMSVVLCPIP